MTISLNSNDRLALLALLVLLDGLFLLIYAPTLAVSEGEAALFFYQEGWLAEMTRLSVSLLGQNNFGIRFPFVLLHLINVLLIYRVALDVVKKPGDALLAAAVFALLPGVNSAAVLISSAGVVILITLCFALLAPRRPLMAAGLLFFAAWLDGAFVLLAFAAVFYAYSRRDWPLLAAAAASFALCLALHGFDTRGVPRGYFLDIFGLYGAIFSPLIFIFFIYTLYWYPLRSPRPLPVLWYLAVAPFALSVALSLRQNLPMQDFGPYAVAATPLMAVAFMNSWRIRLPGYRRAHGWMFGTAFVLLIMLAALSIFHKPFYLLLENPRQHFAYEHHFVDELAEKLKAQGIGQVWADSQSVQTRLRFYGINEGGPFALSRTPPKTAALPLEFSAAGRVVVVYYLWVPEAK